jgi:hypothetical protein
MPRATLAPITFRSATPAVAITLAPNPSEKRLYAPALISTDIYYNYRTKGYITREYTQPKRAMDVKDIKGKAKVNIF